MLYNFIAYCQCNSLGMSVDGCFFADYLTLCAYAGMVNSCENKQAYECPIPNTVL